MCRARKSSRWHTLERAPLLRRLYLFSHKSKAFLQGVVGKPSLLLGGLGLGVLAQGQLTPRPALEVGALLILSTLFLLSPTLERRKAWLSPRQLLIKALFFFLPLTIGLWCRTLPSLLPSLPLYATSALLFIACKRGKDVKVVDRLNLAPPDPLGKGKGKGAYLNLPRSCPDSSNTTLKPSSIHSLSLQERSQFLPTRRRRRGRMETIRLVRPRNI